MRRSVPNVALLEIFEERADPLAGDEPVRALVRELNERHVAAERSTGSALAAVVASGPAVAALVECVHAWLAREPGRRARICRGQARIELAGPSPECRQRLVEWLMEHIETDGPGDRTTN
jgi:hypothetical protein